MPEKDYRALLTDREREILEETADVSDSYRYRVVTRVRDKIERLGAVDLRVLEESHATLGDELRAAVCDDGPERVDDPADDDARLKRLSTDLGEPITVGETVYEGGDAHPLDADDATDVGTSSTAPAGRERDESTPDAPESVEGGDVGALDLPGRGDDLRRRQDAVRAVLDHLRAEGEARAGDLRALAWSTDGGTYADAQSLWKNAVLPALGALDAAESSGPSGKWRWVDE